MPMGIRVARPGGRVVVLQVHGAVDAAGEPWLAEVLREWLDSVAARLVLDLSQVTFFDSEAVMTLLDAAHHARIHAKPFTVISSPAVDRITGLLAVDDRLLGQHRGRCRTRHRRDPADLEKLEADHAPDRPPRDR